jgi:phosphoenolpyruvate---glycerone phosphotransferase subunit DhaL
VALAVIDGISNGIEKNVQYLTELDQAVGDGDHGINLGKGFRAVKEKLSELKGKDIGVILNTVGQTLIANVGGAAGPLYGTAFLRAGMAAEGRNEVDLTMVVKMLEAAERGIIDIGGANLGEKTMLDALHPAVLAAKQAEQEKRPLAEALGMCAKAAEEGAKNTTSMVSRRGRSSYLGERSRGHQDVGAVSTYIMIKSALDALRSIGHQDKLKADRPT